MNVDTLEIQIKTSAHLATDELNKLGSALDVVGNKLNKIQSSFHLDVTPFTQAAKEVEQAFSKVVDVSDKMAKSFQKLSNISAPNVSGLGKMMDTIKSIGDMPNVENSVNRFVSSMARLASAGDKISAVNKDLPSLTANLRKAMESLNKMPNISEPTNIFVRSIAQLANAGNKTGQTAAQLKALAQAVAEFFQTMSRTAQVSENTIRLMEALSRLASAGNRTSSSFRGMQAAMSGSRHGSIALGSAVKSVGAALFGMLGNVKNVSVHTVKSALNTKKLADAMYSINTSVRKATSSMKSFVQQLSAAAGVYLSLYGAIRGLKNSIETASSLTEIQNVIDVTFGSAKQKIEDLAKVSITDFGMSELTTKQIAGRFQGMGKAAGFTTNKMADMSVELTKLAADMASFYDVSQKDVAKSLESVFTGTTTPLRRYGLDITQATLQNWLLKKGIDASVQSMTQQEKILLRYAYVMENTAAAQGDFARTANTWANQVRVLKQAFEVLGSTIGGVLINILKPFVTTLNKLMLKINDFAKVISDSLGTIFGWTYEDSTKGIVNDFEEGFEDVSDSIGEADKEAKKLKRTILGFDQLNILSDNSDLKDTFDKLGDVLSSSVDTGEWKSGGDTLLKSFNSDLDTLEKLGEEIGARLTNAMNSIDWDEIYSKASSFGSGLASFLNGLITPELFEALGSTIAGSLNTALHFLDDFGEEFKWKKFGKSIAKGLKKFFSDFDWELAVKTFNTLVNGILDTIIAALGEISADDWKKVAQKIADMTAEIDASKISFKLGKIANELANAFYILVSNPETWQNLGQKISDGINGFLKGMNEVDEETGLNGWEALGKGISKSISGILTTITTALKGIKWRKVGKAIIQFIENIEFDEIGIDLAKLVNTMAKSIKNLVGNPEQWHGTGKKLASGINKYFETWKPEQLASAANAVVDALKSAISGLMKKLKWKDILDKIDTFLGNLDLDTIGFTVGSFLLLTKAGRKLTGKIFKKLIMTPITNLFTSAFGASAVSSAAAGLASIAIPVSIGLAISLKSVEWKESLEETEEKLREAFKKGNVSDYFSAELEKLKNPYNTINSVGGGILDNTNKSTIEEQKKELEKNGSWFGGMMTDEELQENVKMIKDKIAEFWGENVKLPVEGSLKNAKENVEKWKSDIEQKWNILKLATENKLETTKENLNEFKEKLKGLWGTFKLGIWNKLETTGKNIEDFYEKIKNWWGTKKLKVGNTLTTLKSDVAEWWSKIKNWFGEKTLKVSSKLSTLQSDIANWWKDIKDWWGEKTLSVKVVFETIQNAVKGVVGSVGDFFTGDSKKSVSSYTLRSPNEIFQQSESADLGWYSKGGVFDRASVIGVGESGREAVLPLQNKQTMSMLADSIMNNYSVAGNQGFLEDIKEEIKDAVIQGMMEVFMATRDNQQTVNVTCDARLNVDSEQLARAVMKGQQKLDRRYNLAH